MSDALGILGVVAVLFVVQYAMYRWQTRRKVREPFAYQDWQAEERRQRVASLKAPAPKGFDGQGERRLRRRSS